MGYYFRGESSYQLGMIAMIRQDDTGSHLKGRDGIERQVVPGYYQGELVHDELGCVSRTRWKQA
jgi:hypothetical protein